MQGLSIARSLRFALTALTFVLAVVAALGVASLYSSRQQYEDALLQSSELSTAAANLASAGVVEAAVLRDVRGPGAAAARAQAASAYAQALAAARSLARGDAASIRLLRTAPVEQARTLATRLQARQQARQRAARAHARSDSRHALLLVVVAGALALVAALALVTALVGSMRRPLDALVRATRDLAAGKLDRRVEPSGPRELQDLGAAFNTMGSELARAQRHIEDERHRLAVTVESLGDALVVTEPGGTTIATVNPRRRSRSRARRQRPHGRPGQPAAAARGGASRRDDNRAPRPRARGHCSSSRR